MAEAEENAVTFNVQAFWDSEAGVWVAESDDVPGLVTEAPTPQGLLEKLRVLVPELLELNNCIPRTKEIRLRIHGDYEERISLRSA